MRRPLRSRHASKLVVVAPEREARRSEPNPPLPPATRRRRWHETSSSAGRRGREASRGVKSVAPHAKACSRAGTPSDASSRRASAATAMPSRSDAASSNARHRVVPSRTRTKTCATIAADVGGRGRRARRMARRAEAPRGENSAPAPGRRAGNGPSEMRIRHAPPAGARSRPVVPRTRGPDSMEKAGARARKRAPTSPGRETSYSDRARSPPPTRGS